MKVFELAKEFKTTNEHVLEKLRSLKLKAKDGEQELSKAVTIVLKSELIKEMKKASRLKTQKKPERTPFVEKDLEAVSDTETASEDEAPAKSHRMKKTAESVPPEDETFSAEKSDMDEPSAVSEEVQAAAEESQERSSQPSVVEAQARTVEVPAASEAGPAVVKNPAVSEALTTGKKSRKAGKKPEVVPYTGALDFKVGEAAVPEKRKRFVKKGAIKAKTRSAEPFIPLKPFNKKKKKAVRGQDSGVARQPGVENVDLPKPVADEDLRPLELNVPIAVKDFANCIDQKAGVVLQTLMQMRIFANINQNLDEDVVIELAKKFGYEYVQVKTQEEQIIEIHQEEDEDPSKLTSRAPVVTFMGHVDHGKTSLLDRIRKSKIADQEHGGITQHIGAYSVEMGRGRITFLDTPGHEAFTAMRSRGAHITDIVVLVVAADEGIMPQTQEAIDHARAADVPIVVALNKMDRPGANPDQVKKQLAERGLASEDWGGQTIVVPVSAMTGDGIDALLEMILLESEMLELKANKDKLGSGIVVEAHLSPGRGAVSTLIVQSGTLKVNDFIVVGMHYGKIKAMFNDYGKRMDEAGPSTPVEVLGLDGVPEAGSMFYVVEDESVARQITEKRRLQEKGRRLGAAQRITLEDLYSRIQEGAVKELNVILKADVQGSLEALRDSLAKIPSEEVKVKFVHMGVGDINASDVILAVASNAIIIAFHVGISPRAALELDKEPVDVREYRIIYDAVDDIKKSLSGLLAPKIKRTFLARVEVRQIFKLSRSGLIAGCFVVKGKVKRRDRAEVFRDGKPVYDGQIATLKRFKEDVREVAEGYECGLTLDKFDDLQEGDMIEVYHVEEIARTI